MIVCRQLRRLNTLNIAHILLLLLSSKRASRVHFAIMQHGRIINQIWRVIIRIGGRIIKVYIRPGLMMLLQLLAQVHRPVLVALRQIRVQIVIQRAIARNQVVIPRQTIRI